MVPNFPTIFNISPVAGKFYTLGDFISGLLNITVSVSVFLCFFWLVWGAFQYLTAGGEKQKLAQARARITWALVGLLLVAIAFLVAQFTAQIFPQFKGTPKQITPII